MQLSRVNEYALPFIEADCFAIHEIPHMAAHNVSEFEIDMPMAFRTHVRILAQ